MADTSELLERLRAICLALPEATEKLTWGEHPTFRVRDRIFAEFHDNHHRDGRVAVWCKGQPGAQAAYVGSEPGVYFVPPYVGQHGWIGVHLDRADWDDLIDLIAESYRLTAPKRLRALLASGS